MSCLEANGIRKLTRSHLKNASRVIARSPSPVEVNELDEINSAKDDEAI
jgi:hypothetical protein